MDKRSHCSTPLPKLVLVQVFGDSHPSGVVSRGFGLHSRWLVLVASPWLFYTCSSWLQTVSSYGAVLLYPARPLSEDTELAPSLLILPL